MSQAVRLGIIGGGWPGVKHAEGAKACGGYRLTAVADLIPERRRAIAALQAGVREYDDAASLIKDPDIDAVTIALPNHLHAPVAIAALRVGKHVLLEKPPAMTAAQAKKIATACEKAGKTLLYALQRRFGPAEQAARLAIEKGYAGNIYHARAQWLRTRGIPLGTGWFTDKSKSGGGAMIDIGVHMLDLAWWLMGQPKPLAVMAVTHQKLGTDLPPGTLCDVEDAAFALIRFEGGKSIELSASWALNQPPQQQGTLCRLFGELGGIDVYTPEGAQIHRQFDAKGQSKPTALKPPRLTGHTALLRHFRDCILGKAKPTIGPAEGLVTMRILDAIYKSAKTGKSVAI